MESWWTPTGEDLFPFCGLFEDYPLTAIARMYTPLGFVVAADGRELDHKTKSVATDEAQKILHLHHKSARLICSIAGYARWKEFHAVSEIAASAKVIAKIDIINPDHYVDLFIAELDKAIKRTGSPDTHAHKYEETCLFLDGYILGRPTRRSITFKHERNKTIINPSDGDLRPGQMRGHGSVKVYNALFDEFSPDSSLSSYRIKCQSKPETMSAMTDQCEALIRAHCDPEALLIDQGICNGIGGHIHMAMLTPDAGFQWVPGFEPVLESPQSITENAATPRRTNAGQRWNRLFLVAVICWAVFCLFVQPILMAREGTAHWAKERDECRSGIYSKDPSRCLFVADLEYHTGLYAGFGERYDERQGDWSYPWYFKKLWPLLLIEIVVLPALVYGVAWVTVRVSVWIWRGSKKNRFTQL